MTILVGVSENELIARLQDRTTLTITGEAASTCWAALRGSLERVSGLNLIHRSLNIGQEQTSAQNTISKYRHGLSGLLPRSAGSSVFGNSSLRSGVCSAPCLLREAIVNVQVGERRGRRSQREREQPVGSFAISPHRAAGPR